MLKWWKPRETLTNDAHVRRAEHAKRLIADETLNDAIDAMAEDAFSDMMKLSNSAEADRDRLIATERLRLLKDFRDQLSTYVTLGTAAKGRARP